jgi:hypothetical protein
VIVNLQKRIEQLSAKALEAGDEEVSEVVTELRKALREQYDRSRKLIVDRARQTLRRPKPAA